jgi:hypothetical protein
LSTRADQTRSDQTRADRTEEGQLEPALSSPPKPESKLKHWYVVVAIGVLNAVLLLLVLNLVLYVIIRVRQPEQVPFHKGHFDIEKLQQAYPGWSEENVKALIRETPRADHEFEYEPLTGFRERPFRGRFVNVDAAGFRYSKNQAPWPPRPGVTNVFVFGGSTAFGYYLPDDETISSYLQECAATQHSNAPIAVYNFARPAYFSSQELILFQKLLRDGHAPQIAIFIDGLNDFIFTDGDPKFTGQLRSFMNGQVNYNPLNNVPMIRATHWLEDHLSKPAPDNQPAEKPSYENPAVMQGVVDRWLANKKMIELTAAGYGVRTIFVWQPIPMYRYDLRYHFMVHSDAGFAGYITPKYGYPLIENLRTEGKLGSDFLWLADMQQDKHENLYVDSVHYTAAFSKEIARRICDAIYPR